MKKLIALTLAVVVIALVAVTSAFAHTSAMAVQAVCNTTTGLYDVTWTVGPTTDQDKAPKVIASNRSAIPVGAALGVSTSFTESIPGTSTSVSAAITVRWSDNVKSNPTASLALSGACKVTTKCPAGYEDKGIVDGVRLCTKETTTTVTVPGPPPPPVTVTVFGKPNCAAGTTEVSRGEGYVVCQVTKTVPGKTPKPRVIVKWKKSKPKIIVKRVKYCPVPPNGLPDLPFTG